MAEPFEDTETVAVPGVGELNFPRGMSDDAKREAIERNYGPQLRAARNPEDVTAGMALRGVPVLGAYVPQAEAAIRAAMGKGRGESFAERYASLVPEREAQYAQAERESPITSGALQVGGGTVALAPLGATALGGRLLGTTGGLLSRTAAGGASSAALSAADAYARGEDPGTAALLGGGVGAAAAPIASGIGRMISPFQRSAERAAAARLLEQEGVTSLTAGQKIGGWLRWPEASLGDISGAAGEMIEQQQKQFTRAAAAKAGITADELTPNTINDAVKTWKTRADDLAEKTAVWGTGNIRQLGDDLQKQVQNYALLSQGAPGKAPEHFLARIIDATAQNGGIIPGKIFRSITSDMQTLINTTGNADIKNTLSAMRNSMFGAMERGAAGTPYGNLWRQLNKQYANLMTLRDAVGNAKESTALAGTITPMDLYRAIGSERYARGLSDFEPLTRAGLALMKPLPQSGTAPRSYWMTTVPTAVGATAGGLFAGLPGAVAGGMAGIAGPPIAGRALMHPWMQRYLANQMLTRTPQLPAYAAPIAGALNGQ
jgi:hypothetical protein